MIKKVNKKLIKYQLKEDIRYQALLEVIGFLNHIEGRVGDEAFAYIYKIVEYAIEAK